MALLHEWICIKKRIIEKQNQCKERETKHSDRSPSADDGVAHLTYANTSENGLIEK